jgi:hypothetical protein
MDYRERKLKFLKEFRIVLYINYRCYIALGIVKGHF